MNQTHDTDKRSDSLKNKLMFRVPKYWQSVQTSISKATAKYNVSYYRSTHTDTHIQTKEPQRVAGKWDERGSNDDERR